MFKKSSAILILSVCLSGIAIGVSICIAFLTYYSHTEPRLYAVAVVGLIGAFVCLVESVREFEADHKRVVVAERKWLGAL